MPTQYPIGQPGQKWGKEQIEQWRARQQYQRSYKDEVLDKLQQLPSACVAEQYGELQYQKSYPLMAIKSAQWVANRATILVTGGVHGYETSGVQGALLFAKEYLEQYQNEFNIVITPCVSPWGYEHIQRWNPNAVDPNRSFYPNTPSDEARLLSEYVATIKSPIVLHMDLHETTDSDEQEFRPALAARDGEEFQPEQIPDGFYCVGKTENPQLGFLEAVIESVKTVTHIAPADAKGQIIGSKVLSEGVIMYAMQELGLCGSLTNANYHTTTEVYPDSPKANDDICNQAQIASLLGAINYLKAHA
ncbi:M14 family metallocarboxypeptidase [Celerinatantimonas sp. MCCC 1A17872]|uniref:M14 family metallopeptidase n=1 Tax=Celerinatantimonas sp. MCCC 1A17872 TaxID=3177514 RepID=UPI0038C218F2